MNQKKIIIPTIIISCLISILMGIIIAANFNWTKSSIALQEKASLKQKELSQEAFIPGNTFVNIAKEINPAVVYISSTQVVKGFRFHTPLKDPFRDFLAMIFLTNFSEYLRVSLNKKA